MRSNGNTNQPAPVVERIDIFFLADGRATVSKLGFTPLSNGRMVVLDHDVKPADWDPEVALSWFGEHDWEIRRWQATSLKPAGIRAFKDGLKPIRTERQILALRGQLIAAGVPTEYFDLRYDL